MADQETDFQVALLHQLADLADVIHHSRAVSPDHKTDRAHESMSHDHEHTMHDRADDFEAIYGNQ